MNGVFSFARGSHALLLLSLCPASLVWGAATHDETAGSRQMVSEILPSSLRAPSKEELRKVRDHVVAASGRADAKSDEKDENGKHLWSEAVNLLDGIFASPFRWDVSKKWNPQLSRDEYSCRDLHEEARKILFRKPELLKLYRDSLEGIAAQQMNAAREKGDPEALYRVAKQYRYTRTGQEALLMLALYHLERGNALRAAALYESWLTDQASLGLKKDIPQGARLRAAKAFSMAGMAPEKEEQLKALGSEVKLGQKTFGENEIREYVERESPQVSQSFRIALSELSQWRANPGAASDIEAIVDFDPKFLKRRLPAMASLAAQLRRHSAQAWLSGNQDQGRLIDTCLDLGNNARWDGDSLAVLNATKNLLLSYDNASEAQRNQHLKDLLDLGDRATPVIATLMESLKGPNRGSATKVLGHIGERALPSLIEGLEHKDPRIRSGAAMALFEMREKAAPAIPALIRALGDYEKFEEGKEGLRFPVTTEVSQWAEHALAAIGAKAKPAIIAALEHEDPKIRRRAPRALGRTPAAIPALIRLLSDESTVDESHGDTVARAFWGMGGGAVPPLMEVLQTAIDKPDEKTNNTLNSWIGHRAVKALSHTQLRPESDAATPLLIRALGVKGEAHETLRKAALHELASFGRDCAPDLVRALGDPDFQVRAAAVQALFQKCGSYDTLGNKERCEERIERPVRLALKDTNPNARYRAAEFLKLRATMSGGLSEGSIWGLIEAFRDEDRNVRSMAVEALAKSHRAVPHLVNVLGDRDTNITFYAIKALGGLPDPRSRSHSENVDFVTRKIEEALSYDTRASARSRMVDALGELIRRDTYFRERHDGSNQASVRIVPLLVKALEDSDSNVRYRAVEALGDVPRLYGSPGEGTFKLVISTLEKALEDPKVRGVAEINLRKILDKK